MMSKILAVHISCACAFALGCASHKNGADSDGGMACSATSNCGGTTPICSSNGYCVQCETGTDCPADMPLCSADTCTASCAGTAIAADFVKLPSDIIWVVDQTASMTQETQYVQQKINEFANLIGGSGVDYHVVMIASPTSANPICVPPPLAGANCDDNVRFKLVPVRVGSTNGPQRAIDNYAAYSSFLRPNATKNFVFVTDDNSALSAAGFTSSVLAPPPMLLCHTPDRTVSVAWERGRRHDVRGPDVHRSDVRVPDTALAFARGPTAAQLDAALRVGEVHPDVSIVCRVLGLHLQAHERRGSTRGPRGQPLRGAGRPRQHRRPGAINRAGAGARARARGHVGRESVATTYGAPASHSAVSGYQCARGARSSMREGHDDPKVSVTIDPVFLIAGIVEANVEIAAAPHLGVQALAGYGSVMGTRLGELGELGVEANVMRPGGQSARGRPPPCATAP